MSYSTFDTGKTLHILKFFILIQVKTPVFPQVVHIEIVKKKNAHYKCQKNEDSQGTVGVIKKFLFRIYSITVKR